MSQETLTPSPPTAQLEAPVPDYGIELDKPVEVSPQELAYMGEQAIAGAPQSLAEQDLGDASPRAIVAKSGSMPPTWKQRSVASESVVSAFEDDRGVVGSNIGELGYQKAYTVDKVPIAIGLSGPEGTVYQSVATMSAEDKRFHGVDTEISQANFDGLDPQVKQALFTDRLQQIEAMSQSVDARVVATHKNIERVESGVALKAGDYIHGFVIDKLPSILNKGLVSGEGLGMPDGKSATFDRFPYNLDAYDAEAGELIKDATLDMRKTVYGDAIAVIDRGPDAIDHGNEPDSERPWAHRLIFGGVPATDIRGIHVRSEFRHGQAEVINDLVTEGFYIPVYDHQGELLLTYDDFVDRCQTGRLEPTTREIASANKSWQL